MLYAAEIFCTNKLQHKSPTTGTLGKMARIQCQLTLQITGALRSTATDVLNICADLLPFKLLVHKVCFRALTRLPSLPPSHPLYSQINSKLDFNIKRHRSPLHHLRHTFDLDPAAVEKIDYLNTNPREYPNVPVRIDNSKEDAIWTYLLKPTLVGNPIEGDNESSRVHQPGLFVLCRHAG